jgi:hypothetical protein
MTAYVIHLTPSKLTVACDTLGYLVGPQVRPYAFLQKVLPLHFGDRALLFGRGQAELIATAYAMLMLGQDEVETLEDVAARLPGILEAATSTFAAEHDLGDWRAVALLQGSLGGFSARERHGDAVGCSAANWRHVDRKGNHQGDVCPA